MAQVHVEAEAPVAAPAEQVYMCIADYRQHHPHILPPAFSDLQVEQGGVGAGTVITFKAKLGGRTEQGRVLTESEIGGRGIVTTFTVVPEGEGSRVRIASDWEARGVSGIVERLLAPRMLRRIYTDELGRLDRYARSLTALPAAPAP